MSDHRDTVRSLRSGTRFIAAMGAVGILLALTASSAHASDIKKFQAECLADVQGTCVKQLCPEVCDLQNKSDADRAKCKLSCTPQDKCKMKALGRPEDSPLENQNRMAFTACVVEKRDAVVRPGVKPAPAPAPPAFARDPVGKVLGPKKPGPKGAIKPAKPNLRPASIDRPAPWKTRVSPSLAKLRSTKP